MQIDIEDFPAPGNRIAISRDGGVHPRWNADGTELYFYGADGQLMMVPVAVTADGKALNVKPAVPLFKMNALNGPLSQVGFGPQYDVTRDGRMFLVNAPVQNEQPSIAVVVNWMADLAGN